MLHPYLLMTALYASLAVLAALDYSLTNLGFLDSFSGVRWLRVHLITLGMLTEVLFALMPALTALRAPAAAAHALGHMADPECRPDHSADRHPAD